MEKSALVVISSAMKLKPYSNAHQIVELTDMSLEKALDNFEKSGRLANWVVELNGYGIKHQSITAIKAQALADVLSKFSYQEKSDLSSNVWELYTDGSSTAHGLSFSLLKERQLSTQ